MLKIVGTLPVKTRLPFAAWALAELVTLVSFGKFTSAYQQSHRRGSEASHGSVCLCD